MWKLLGVLVVITACSQPTTAVGGDVGAADADVQFTLDGAAGTDAAVDGDPDAPLGTDALADAKDAAADAAADALTDAVADATPDALTDAVVDVATDAVADVPPDAVADVPPDVAPDVPPDAPVADVADVPDVVTADVPIAANKTGCADGTREGFGDPSKFPTIAACGGAWDQPGIFNMPAKCGNQAGNDGVNAAGTGCTVSDLCAVGWHVCYGKDDVVFRNGDGCAGVMTGATPPVFFTTQMSSSGSFNCASGAAATNDLFGCGNLGCDFTGNATCKALCSPLTLSSHDLCKGLRNDLGCGDWCNHLGKYPGAPNAWDCGTDGDKEALNVVKSHPEQQGGVLCCLD